MSFMISKLQYKIVTEYSHAYALLTPVKFLQKICRIVSNVA